MRFSCGEPIHLDIYKRDDRGCHDGEIIILAGLNGSRDN